MKMNAIPSAKAQAGFTLIELVAVIVILGILSATALPRFVDLSDSAEQAALKGVAGALSSAAALNHANNLASDAGLTTTTTITAVNSCADVVPMLQGGLPDTTKYAVPDTASTASEGTAFTCAVTYTATTGATPLSENFTAYVVTAPATP